MRASIAKLLGQSHQNLLKCVPWSSCVHLIFSSSAYLMTSRRPCLSGHSFDPIFLKLKIWVNWVMASFPISIQLSASSSSCPNGRWSNLYKLKYHKIKNKVKILINFDLLITNTSTFFLIWPLFPLKRWSKIWFSIKWALETTVFIQIFRNWKFEKSLGSIGFLFSLFKYYINYISK